MVIRLTQENVYEDMGNLRSGAGDEIILRDIDGPNVVMVLG